MWDPFHTAIQNEMLECGLLVEQVAGSSLAGRSERDMRPCPGVNQTLTTTTRLRPRR